jgi:DNA-binding NarL/FixJ family response regulator
MPIKPKNIITILIADDHPSTRDGIRSILEKVPDMQITGEAGDGDQIKSKAEELQPDILLLDLKMPNLSPWKLEKWVRKHYPDTTTIVLTAHDRDAYLANMMEAGVAGYLDKKLRAGQLISAIRRAANGEILFEKEQVERAFQWVKNVKDRWESLSDREREILQLLTEGKDNKTIAGALEITINTVEKYLSNIYKKLGVTSRTAAILWWLEKSTDFRT